MLLGLGYSLPLLIFLVQGVRGEMGTELTSLIVVGVLAGILCVILLFVIPAVCYLRRSQAASRDTKKKRHVANGDVRHRKPREQNGIPITMMNGNIRRGKPRHPRDSIPPSQATVSMMSSMMSYPYIGPTPMVGTSRGPAPQPIIIGAPRGTYSRGAYPNGTHSNGTTSNRMPPRGTFSGVNPYMGHMQAPYHPYDFHPQYQYPGMVIVETDSSSDSSSSSGRSTMRERKSRYQRHFPHRNRIPSQMIINDSSSETITYGEINEEKNQRRSKEMVKGKPVTLVKEEHNIERPRSRSRSRSRSPAPRLHDIRQTRPISDDSDFGIFQPPAGPNSGDVTYAHPEQNPPARKPSPEPMDYTYASVIKPEPVTAEPLQTTGDWGEPDQDIRRATTQDIGLSMSERLLGIVEDGWSSPLINYGGQNSSAIPSQSLSQTRKEEDDYDVLLRKSRRDGDVHPIQSREDDEEFAIRQSRKQDVDPYGYTSTHRNPMHHPPSPPVDIPSSIASPRESFIPDYPTSEPQSQDRPVTPPFDAQGFTPKPSVKSRAESPPPKRASAIPNILSQSQSQKVQRSMFTNDVLKELKKRQTLEVDLLEDDSQSRGVNFSARSPTVISPVDLEPPQFPQFNGVPAPPPPPPVPY